MDNQVLKELRQNFFVLVELYPGALRVFIDLLISVFWSCKRPPALV